MQKGSKEWQEAKAAGRAAVDAKEANRIHPVTDSTIGHEDGPEGTWNTSGVEVPANRGAVRDVRPETGDAVSLEGLKEAGVPVRDESDHGSIDAPLDAPIAEEKITEPTGEKPAASKAASAKTGKAAGAKKTK